MKEIIKVISLILVAIIVLSTISYAIYRATTIGTDKLSFNLVVSTTVGGETPIIEIINPEVVTGMIPIIYTGTNWVITNIYDTNWYNYDTINKIWANTMLSDGRYKVNNGTIVDSQNDNSPVLTDGTQTIAEADLGSMFVWIPRYEYKITATENSKTIDINFIAKTTTTPTDGFTIHPAFTDGIDNNFENGEWDSEIAGFWMAKFEASNSTGSYVANSGHIKILPNKYGWSNEDVSEAFENCMNMNTVYATEYGITATSGAGIVAADTHMTKNSEWGAVAYLAYSEYGRNGIQPNVNNYMTDKTAGRRTNTGTGGNSINATAVTSIGANHRYNQTYGLLASTTANITGVYDMNGGLNEHTAGMYIGKTISQYSTSTKYTTVYVNSNMQTNGKIGDAMKETYHWDNNAIGSGTADNVLITQYFMRGGGPSDGSKTEKSSGLFSFYNSDGVGGTGGLSPDYRGFRPILIAK